MALINVSGWNPVTKLLIAVAVPAVSYLLITSRDTSSVAAVAPVAPPTAAAAGDDADPLMLDTPRPTLPAMAAFSAFVERPLFTPLRRPVQHEAPASAAPAAGPVASAVPEPDFRFVGTVIRRSRILGLLAPNRGGELVGVGLGDTIDGWTVRSLSGIDLVVQQAAEERHLTMFR